MLDLSQVRLEGLHFVSKLGSGGMGDVWLARDESLDIEVAVKVLPLELASDQNFVMRFLREARAIARLNHENIVGVLQAGKREHQGMLLRVMVMEYIDGLDAGRLREADIDGKLAPIKAAQITLGTARALRYAHAKGVIHRDIKPANILCGKDGTIKVLDFGLAKLAEGHVGRGTRFEAPSVLELESDSSGDMIVGTPHYMSPEQAKGRLTDGRTDIYSLGITLYELLTGLLPFDGESAFSIISGHIDDPLPLTPERFGDIEAVFSELIAGMCAKSPENRLTLDHVIHELEAYLGLTSVGSSSALSVGDTPQIRTNLARRRTSFVGRDKELLALRSHFDNRARLVTILGPGGVGKTRISQEFGTSSLNHFHGGVFFCDLTESRSVEGICAEVAKGIGLALKGDGVREIHETLQCRQGRLLVILDNFEQVVHFSPETLGVWMRDTPNVSFLASSREPLHLEGEECFVLHPLEANEYAAGVALFIDRAIAANRNFGADAETRSVIAKIARALDGIPLAIELAAARVSSFSPQKILERLPRRFELLKGRRQDQSQRQLTMRGAIDWSWNLLTPVERSALAQCSVFQGGFSLEAAEAVLSLDAFEDAPFEMDVIEALVEKSLIVAYEIKDLPGESRFKLFESIRQYAEEKLMQFGEVEESGNFDLDALWQRHADHYLRYAEFWDRKIYSAEGFEALTRIELEIENLFAIHEGIGGRIPEYAARAILAANNTLKTRGPTSSVAPRLESALEALGEELPVLRARLLATLCRTQAYLGDRAKAAAFAELAIKESRELGENPQGREALAMALGASGWLFQSTGEVDRAIACYREAETINRAANSLVALAAVICNIGIIHSDRQEFEDALKHYAEAEGINREIGNQLWVAANVGNRGSILNRMGDIEGALACYREAGEIFQRLGDKLGSAINLGNLGFILLGRGDFEGAWQAFDRAEETSRDIGAKRPLCYWLFGKSRVLLSQERNPAEILPLIQECLNHRREMVMTKNFEFFQSLASIAQVQVRLAKSAASPKEAKEHLAAAHAFAEEAQALGEELSIPRVYSEGQASNGNDEYWQWIEEALA